MKTSSKVSLLVATFVLISVVLVGCGNQGSSSTASTSASSGGAKVELTLLDSFLDNLSESYVVSLNAKIKEFQANHPEITLTRDQSSSDVLDTKVPTLGAANQLPDMFAARSAWTPNFADAGEVMSIEDLMKDNPQFMAGFIPGMLDDFAYKGAHYGIPWQSTPIYIMYFNMDLLKQAGINKVPTSFDELVADVKALKAKGITPIAMGDKGKWQSRLLFSALNVRTAGGDYLERLKAGTLKFTDPQFQKSVGAIETLARAGAYNKDFTSIDYTQARALYYAKKVAMYGEMITFAQVENDQWPDDVKSATQMSYFPQLPGEDLSKGIAVPVATDWGIAFNSKLSGDKLKAAKLFAVEVLGDDYNKLLEQNGGMGVRKVEGADLSKIPEAEKRYSEQLAPTMTVGGHIDGRMPGAVLDSVSANLQDLIIGGENTNQALQKIQAALDKTLTTK